MKLESLPKVVARSKKRPGRGLGSGKGKTGGRGQKGQKARGSIALGFIGGTLPMYKKLPYRRGLGNAKVSPKLRPLSLARLAALKQGTVVDLACLIDNRIVKEKDIKHVGIKIVGSGEVSKGLVIRLPISAKAASIVEKEGGKIESA